MTDTLDIEDFAALLAYLRRTGRIAAEESPRMTNLAGGVSNRTVLLEREDGQAWVLKQALGRLRVAVEWLSDPRRIEREAAGIQCLTELAPPGTITPLLFLDPAVHLLAMQAVPRPHENWKTMLLAGHLKHDHVRQFAQLLGTIHHRSSQRRDELDIAFEDQTFFESLRLEPYYLYAASQSPAAASFLHDLVQTTRQTRWSIVHGDYSPKNVLVREDRLILLDHEVIHFGDPGFDLGFSFAHLLSKAHFLIRHRADFLAAAHLYWQTYLQEVRAAPWARQIESRAVAHTLGCLLARCRGRSPLEYLSPAYRDRQERIVVDMMRQPPGGMGELIDGFGRRHIQGELDGGD